VRRLRWDTHAERPIPKRPYRDTAVFYAVLAAVIVIIAAATGGGIARALIIAAGFFVVATAFSWWRWRVRLRAKEDEQP
jgi:hypothetical protein